MTIHYKNPLPALSLDGIVQVLSQPFYKAVTQMKSIWKPIYGWFRKRGQQNMRNIFVATLVAFTLLIGITITGTDNVQAKAKSRSASRKTSAVKRKNNRNLRAGVPRHRSNDRWAARRESARRRAAAARRAAIARARAIDISLLHTAQNEIIGDDPIGEDPEMR